MSDWDEAETPMQKWEKKKDYEAFVCTRNWLITGSSN